MKIDKQRSRILSQSCCDCFCDSSFRRSTTAGSGEERKTTMLHTRPSLDTKALQEVSPSYRARSDAHPPPHGLPLFPVPPSLDALLRRPDPATQYQAVALHRS